MDTPSKAEAFKALHVKGAPLVLYNVWDAGSAKAVAEAGAPAVATGSWSVAAAQGFEDGELLPLDAALRSAGEIAAAVDLPVSVDFEGGYATDPTEAAQNVAKVMDAGAIGINFEDRVIGGQGLHDIADQVARIVAIRQMADARGVPLFINARSDVFFAGSKADPNDLLAELLERAEAYTKAGADGLFVPGLAEPELIAQFCETQTLPVNVMRMGKSATIADLANAGVARVSHGPGPYLAAMKAVGEAASVLYPS